MPSWLPRRLGGGLGQRQKGTQRFAWKVSSIELARCTCTVRAICGGPYIRTPDFSATEAELVLQYRTDVY